MRLFKLLGSATFLARVPVVLLFWLIWHLFKYFNMPFNRGVKNATKENEMISSSPGFTGLYNQGSTCYLNTALQTLFMTPEFRNEIYMYRLDSNCDDQNQLILELKELFVKLQFGKHHVSTTGITKSLGITNVWVQQDAEEYFQKILNQVGCGVLKFYQSSVSSSTTCRKCQGYQQDSSTYLSIPLALKPDIAGCYSVENGLNHFLKTEILDGENQTYCDYCDDKTDAETRCIFENLPQILTLQLKRFDFDWNHMCHVKNDFPVEIPKTLNFIKVDTKGWVTTDSKQGSVVYELFAIFYHFGSYRGGHYSAEVRLPKTDDWYIFDDSSVNLKSNIQHKKRSRTAYVVMYRTGDTEFLPEKDMPSDVRKMIEKEREKESCKSQPDANPVSDETSDGTDISMDCQESPGTRKAVSPTINFSPNEKNQKRAKLSPEEDNEVQEKRPVEEKARSFEHSAATSEAFICDNKNTFTPAEFVSSNSKMEETSDVSTTEMKEGISTETIIAKLAATIVKPSQYTFKINRANLWDDAVRVFRCSSYDPKQEMLVKFSDDSKQIVEDMDTSGPKREFLSLLMECLKTRTIFDGPEDSKYLIPVFHNEGFRDDEYYLAGRMIAVSMVHGGPGPHFLSKDLFSQIVNYPAAMNDITDEHITAALSKVNQAASQNELGELNEKLLADRCLHSSQSMHIKKSDSSCPNYFQRFTEGLATLGCLHALQQHPQIFERFMCYSEEKLTAKTLGKLFVVCCNGSKNGEKNKTTLGHWRDYLNNCEGHNGGVSLQDILKFATGLRSLPPAGFQPKPYLKFGSVTNLPQAYTSGNYIILPILSSYEHFKNNMDKGIQNPVRVSYV